MDNGRDASTPLQALQNTLLLHPSDDKEAPTILSINPTEWGAQHRVINIGPLLGVRPTTIGRPEDIERGTATAFQAAGWASSRIAQELRQDLKRPVYIDVALLDEDGKLLVAVETKRNAGRDWPRRVRDAWHDLQHKVPGAPWYCVTDGTTFYLRHNGSEKLNELEQAYSQQFNASQALDVATVTKLVRNTTMIVLIPWMGFLSRRRVRVAERQSRGGPRRFPFSSLPTLGSPQCAALVISARIHYSFSTAASGIPYLQPPIKLRAGCSQSQWPL